MNISVPISYERRITNRVDISMAAQPNRLQNTYYYPVKNYRQEKKPLITIVKKFVKQGELLRFAHFYANATTIDATLVFLSNTGITTREWLRSQRRKMRNRKIIRGYAGIRLISAACNGCKTVNTKHLLRGYAL
jgi:hypothetical protein